MYLLHCCGSGSSISSESGSGSGSKVLMTKNLRKKIQLKIFLVFWSKIAIYLSLGLLKGRLAAEKAPKREHPALQNILWVIFAFLDPDPDCKSRYVPSDPIESGSNQDPDPQHWFVETLNETVMLVWTYLLESEESIFLLLRLAGCPWFFFLCRKEPRSPIVNCFFDLYMNLPQLWYSRKSFISFIKHPLLLIVWFPTMFL